jgi:plasmid stabilization system protein ParE
VNADGLLPTAAIQPIRSWLATLAHDQASRAEVVQRTLDGAIGSLAARTPELAQAVEEQTEVIARLRADVDHSYAEAARTVTVQTQDGTLLRGEVLARWHEFVGTGEFFRALEQKISWLRDRVVAAFKGEPPGAANVKVAVESNLEALIREEAEAAAERAEGSWQANAAGRHLLAQSREDLSHPSAGFPAAAARAIRDWQGAVLDLVADEGMGKRSRARFMALGVNGVGVALMIVVFAHTGGLVGAEVGVAGGTAVLAQRVLEAVFGDQAVRRLAQIAKEDLDGRVEALMAAELIRYHAVLDGLGVDQEQADRLRSAARAVETARTGGLPTSEPPSAPALTGAERLELEAPAVRQVDIDQALEDGVGAEIVDAEFIEVQPSEEPSDRRDWR